MSEDQQPKLPKLPELPPELFVAILEAFDSKTSENASTLAKLCLVNKNFREWAIPVFYRRINLNCRRVSRLRMLFWPATERTQPMRAAIRAIYMTFSDHKKHHTTDPIQDLLLVLHTASSTLRSLHVEAIDVRDFDLQQTVIFHSPYTLLQAIRGLKNLVEYIFEPIDTVSSMTNLKNIWHATTSTVPSGSPLRRLAVVHPTLNSNDFWKKLEQVLEHGTLEELLIIHPKLWEEGGPAWQRAGDRLAELLTKAHRQPQLIVFVPRRIGWSSDDRVQMPDTFSSLDNTMASALGPKLRSYGLVFKSGTRSQAVELYSGNAMVAPDPIMALELQSLTIDA